MGNQASHGVSVWREAFGWTGVSMVISSLFSLSTARARQVRVGALLSLLVLVPALFVLGAKPIAVGLIPVPWDKLVHFVLFALLAMLAGLSGGLLRWQGRTVLLLAFFGAVLVGALDEWHQVYLPGRSAGWDDFAADVLAALVGVGVLVWFRLVRRRS